MSGYIFSTKGFQIKFINSSNVRRSHDLCVCSTICNVNNYVLCIQCIDRMHTRLYYTKKSELS